MRVTLAVLHLLALGVGFGAVFARARAANRLRQSADALRATFAADAWWGVAFLLWLITGLWRWLGSVEKTASYYTTNHIFLAKMGLLVVILALELWPMITLIRWRIASGKGTLDAAQLGAKGRLIARISDAQMVLLVGMVIAAVMMTRGFGSP